MPRALLAALGVILVALLASAAPALAALGSISGTVTGPGGTPLEDICVAVSDSDFDNFGAAETVANGTYTVVLPADADYRVGFADCNALYNVVDEYWNDEPTISTADPVAVSNDNTTENVNAELAAGSTMSGTVTGPGNVPLADICVEADNEDFESGGFAETAANGTYAITGLPADTYKVGFSDCNDVHNVAAEYYNDKPDFDSANPVVLAADDTAPNVDALLAAGGSISGTVTGPGNVSLDDICVEVDSVSGDSLGSDETAANGAYLVDDLPAGSHRVEFSDCNDEHGVLTEWFNDKPTFGTADPVAVTAGNTTPGVSAQLAVGGSISGTVTGPGNAPLDDICVEAMTPAGVELDTGVTNGAGAYTIDGVMPGSVRVFFSACGGGNFAAEFFNDKHTLAAATPVPATDGANTPGINAQLAAGGTISGAVTNEANAGIGDVCVVAYDPAGETLGYSYDDTAPNGTYALTGLAGASYKLHFDADCSAAPVDSEYYNNKATFAAANPVAVTAPNTTANINAVLAAGGADLTPPDTGITSGPAAGSTIGVNTAAFTFTSLEGGSTFECKLDGGAFAACTSPKAYAGLANGSHTFSVRATDASGNTDLTPATRTFVVAVATGGGGGGGGTSAACVFAIDDLAAAQTKLKQAKVKLKKAKKGGNPAKIKKAKEAVKKAKQRLSKALGAVEDAC